MRPTHNGLPCPALPRPGSMRSSPPRPPLSSPTHLPVSFHSNTKVGLYVLILYWNCFMNIILRHFTSFSFFRTVVTPHPKPALWGGEG